jgi:hypothetical protein
MSKVKLNKAAQAKLDAFENAVRALAFAEADENVDAYAKAEVARNATYGALRKYLLLQQQAAYQVSTKLL